jgi:hypothetical protein
MNTDTDQQKGTQPQNPDPQEGKPQGSRGDQGFNRDRKHKPDEQDNNGGAADQRNPREFGPTGNGDPATPDRGGWESPELLQDESEASGPPQTGPSN